MALFDRLARDARASIHGVPAEYELGGKVIRCSHCGHARFVRTRPFSMVFAISLSKPVTLECENCGSILWFSKAPQTCDEPKRENV